MKADAIQAAHGRIDPIGNENRVTGTLAGMRAIAMHLGLDPDELQKAAMTRAVQVGNAGFPTAELGTYGAGYLDGILVAVSTLKGESND